MVASVKGFFAVGKQLSHTHSIVDLLQNVSNAFAKVSFFFFKLFASLCFVFFYSYVTLIKRLTFICVLEMMQKAYESLMKAFTDRNKVKLLFCPCY